MEQQRSDILQGGAPRVNALETETETETETEAEEVEEEEELILINQCTPHKHICINLPFKIID